MTSSLVGSEMCIRDSRIAVLIRARGIKMLGVDLAEFQHVVILMCVYAVSYTHLTLPTICSV
eukprot:6260491-Prorocentrum_lima.AAC.1